MTSGKNKSTSDLCGYCSQSFILDDARAEGLTNYIPTESRLRLNFADFEQDKWYNFTGKAPFFRYRVLATLTRTHEPPLRNRVAVMAPERSAVPPALFELTGEQSAGFPTCAFCEVLRDVFFMRYRNEPWWHEDTALLRFTVRYDWSHPVHLLDKISVAVRYPELPTGCKDVFFFSIAAPLGPCQEWLRIPRRPLLNEGRLSHENVRAIKTWLDKCDNGHRNCMAVIDPYVLSYVPRRLIDLQYEGHEDGLALLELAQGYDFPGDDTRYAALSYCWGATLPFVTTLATIARHKTGMCFSHLPVVFREAIIVARKLGIRYLWIDAVCIVQDDITDWERESVQMPYIFAYAFVTICATSSSNCDQSFLQRASIPTIQVPFQSTLRPEIHGQYDIYTQPRHIDEMEDDLELSRWHSRAWIYQERRLARRLLIFGGKMLQLQCREYRRLENGLCDASHGWIPNAAHTGEHLWDICEYSTKKLTFRRDRLNAVSGIARLISGSLEDIFRPKVYLAGLWFDPDLHTVDEHTKWSLDQSVGGHFPGQICWKISDPSSNFLEMMNILKSKETYCAPSWSWASREERISYLCPMETSQKFSVLRWDLPPLNLDAMIAVKPGSSITLQGVMRNFSLRPPRGTFKGASSGIGRTDYYFDWKRDPKSANEERFRLRLRAFVVGRKQYDHVFGLLLLADGDDTVDEDLFDLPAPKFTTRPGTYRMHQSYRRVGVFESRGNYRWIDNTIEVEVTII